MLRTWLTGGGAPLVVQGFRWDPERWRTITARQQGLYRATIALTLSGAPRDFHTAAPLTPELIDEEKIDDHHVFPRGFLRELGRGAESDSVLNHVLIDRATNIRIGKSAPSRYLAEIRLVIGDGLDTVLASHRLPPGPDSPLMEDDYDSFLTWRLEHLDELLRETTGQTGPPTVPMPPRLRTLDTRVEEVELALRQLIRDRLHGDTERVPSHVIQKVRERIDAASRKQPGLGQRPAQDLATQLQYFDLRELQDTLMAKALWPRFADLFMTKEALAMRFAQLAELRNAIRHSRDVTAIMRNDGEAAIRWFGEALEAAQHSASIDSVTPRKS